MKTTNNNASKNYFIEETQNFFNELTMRCQQHSFDTPFTKVNVTDSDTTVIGQLKNKQNATVVVTLSQAIEHVFYLLSSQTSTTLLSSMYSRVQYNYQGTNKHPFSKAFAEGLPTDHQLEQTKQNCQFQRVALGSTVPGATNEPHMHLYNERSPSEQTANEYSSSMFGVSKGSVCIERRLSAFIEKTAGEVEQLQELLPKSTVTRLRAAVGIARLIHDFIQLESVNTITDNTIFITETDDNGFIAVMPL